MTSSSTLFRRKRGARINQEGWDAMVSCKRCASHKGGPLPCRMSSLSKKCGNCESVGGQAACEPVDIPAPDFSRIDKELEKLDAEEAVVEAEIDADEALVQAAFDRIAVRRSKQKRLRKQRKMLKAKEKRAFDRGLQDVEDIERLNALEGFNQEIASVNPEAPAVAQTVDWSSLWDLDAFPVSSSTDGVVVDNSQGWSLVPMYSHCRDILTT